MYQIFDFYAELYFRIELNVLHKLVSKEVVNFLNNHEIIPVNAKFAKSRDVVVKKSYATTKMVASTMPTGNITKTTFGTNNGMT